MIDRHHILPRAVFPVFANLNKNPWNCISLTPSDHLLAHYYLFRALPSNLAMRLAFRFMIGRSFLALIEERNYDEALIAEIVEQYGLIRAGVDVPSIKGWLRVYRGEDDATVIPPDELDSYLKNGWSQTPPKRVWVHREEESLRVLLKDADQYYADGWTYGRGNDYVTKELKVRLKSFAVDHHAKEQLKPEDERYSYMPRGDDHHRRVRGISDETKAKISSTLTGHTQSQDTIDKRNDSRIKNGKRWTWSEEARARVSEARTGRKRNTPSPLRGRVMSEESNVKKSEALKKFHEENPEVQRVSRKRGEDHHYFGKHRDEETRKKISDAMVGKPMEAERKEKIRAALKGRKQSPEHVAAVKAAKAQKIKS